MNGRTIVLVRRFCVQMFLVFRQRLRRLVFYLGLICGGLTHSSEFCHQAGCSSLGRFIHMVMVNTQTHYEVVLERLVLTIIEACSLCMALGFTAMPVNDR